MGAEPTAVGEFEAIERIRRRLPAPGPAPDGAPEVWIGDDAAVLSTVGRPLLVAADVVVAGVHADLDLVGVDDLGWRAVAVNVSDIAAMGGRPRHLLVSVAGPPGTDLDLLYDGVAGAADALACTVVGGDLSGAPVLMVAVTVVGDLDEPGAGGAGPAGPGGGGAGGAAAAGGLRPVLRSGAAAGDVVFVTGALGAAAAGLRLLRAGRRGGPLVEAHRRPVARVAEGRAARRAGATAMIDVSDGFAADLGHILERSGVGVELAAAGPPVAEGATPEEAWQGGDDYELVFTAAPAAADAVAAGFAAAGLRPPVTVGRITADPGQRPAPGGWQHGFR